MDNPTLTVQDGQRYYLENRGWSTHPLAFRDVNGDALLTQDGRGSFENDPEVNWVDTGDIIEFTLTRDLAEELATYGCEVHSSMAGDIEVSFASPPSLPGFDDQPTDIDGDGQFDSTNVQTLFDNFDSSAVQDNPAAFDFAGLENGRVSVFDVQAVYTKRVIG